MIKLEKDKLKLWSAICIISAIPSFYWGFTETNANIPAMFVGVVLFIIGYTAVTSSEFYKKLKQKIFLFQSIRLAFWVRVVYSVVSLGAVFYKNSWGIVNIADWWLGLVSLLIMEFLFGKGRIQLSSLVEGKDTVSQDNANFFITIFTTMTQGILLSMAILLVAIIIWCFLRVKNIVSLNKMVKT